MAVDFANYEGREQAFVKHSFLDKYLPALIGKVCSPQSRYSEFTYVDGFAGPWKSVAGATFEDTSFGIALGHMTAQRLLYLGKGRDIKMRAFLVETDADSFLQLKQAAERFPKIEVVALNGMMEDHVAKIASLIPPTAFSFTLIDPKGFPEISAMMPLLKRQNAEALVNFMFDFANRFAGTELIPKLEAWLSGSGNQDWRTRIEGLAGARREDILVELAVEALRATSGYTFAPVITVDKVLHDRPLYKLIFLSRHQKGLEVFRSSESEALATQAEVRSAARANRRAENSAMDDLFADGVDAIPNDRSAQIIRRSQELAPKSLVDCLTTAGEIGMLWSELWPPILADFSVTRSWLGRQVNELRKSNLVSVPSWSSERKQIPDDDYRLVWMGESPA